MKRWGLLAIAVVLVGAIGAVSLPRLQAYWKSKYGPKFREAAVSQGDIVQVVNSTGTVQPVQKVSIGTFVSGPILELNVDFNSRVVKGEVLAQIDPRLYQAAYDSDQARLSTAEADVKRVTALLQQAINDERRSKLLRAENRDYISDSEMDQFKYARSSLAAQLEVAKAAVIQARANLENSKTNLDYTRITSPVDGIVIDRKIDPGQTLAAQFQTPEMFVVAPDMDVKMLVTASVDEADMGLIKDAQTRGEPVTFTVYAYPEELFEGKISQVRLNHTTTQNVVTYPVVVEAPNPDLKLLPGMTATISFQIRKNAKVLRVPNSAIRFYPKPEQVRPEDKKILEGAAATRTTRETEDENAPLDAQRSAAERAEAGRKRTRRHVWVMDGEFLRAVEIKVGIADNEYTELVEGDLKDGQMLVTGEKPPGQ
jgi:HlyD family secretion protein